MVRTRPAADGDRYEGEEEKLNLAETGLTKGHVRMTIYDRLGELLYDSNITE